MPKGFAKLLGAVALFFGLKVMLDLANGKSADGAIRLAQSVGGGEGAAKALSFFIALLGIGMGLRALLTNRVCVGDECSYDHSRM